MIKKVFFSPLNITFCSNYRKCLASLQQQGIEVIDDTYQAKLFQEYLVTIKINRLRFIWRNSCYISITLSNLDNYEEINQHLHKLYGPDCYYISANQQIFTVAGVEVCHELIEPHFGGLEHRLVIFQNYSYCLLHKNYQQMNSQMESLAKSRNLIYKGIMAHRQIYVHFENSQYRYLIIINKRSIELYQRLITKVNDKIIKESPAWQQTKKISRKTTLSQIVMLIDDFLEYVSEDDQELIKKEF